MKNYDVLIIGCGIAGLSTAITVAEKGLNVCVISKEEKLEECNTYYAQGGIVASGKEDTPEKLKKDIYRAGSSLNCHESVDYLVRNGSGFVNDFLVNKLNVPFIRDENGEPDRTKEAAHSERRIFHIKDETGKILEKSLLSYAQKNRNISFLKNHPAIDIITNSHNSTNTQERYKKTYAMGVYVLNTETENVYPIFASSVVLATGGIGNLFLHTSNPESATGDGIAMAYRAGVEIINAEYVQFHPTILFHRDVKRFLISEALRGEGARLVTKKGEFFMDTYNPELKDLAPRDEVARAIYREMESNGGYVLLDTSGIKNVSLIERFPGIYQKCKSLGIDITKDSIPVVPAAHYFCGGVKVDINGRTRISGLFSVGETSCTGVHGANRLASVSLLEGLVFGIKTGEYIANKERTNSERPNSSIPEWIYPVEEENFDPVLIRNDLLNIQSTMWNYVGIIRTKKRLSRAISDLNYMNHRIEQFYKKAKISKEIIELRNAVVTASIIAKSASKNPRSTGCHFIQ